LRDGLIAKQQEESGDQAIVHGDSDGAPGFIVRPGGRPFVQGER
jgi:hypothetical protein